MVCVLQKCKNVFLMSVTKAYSAFYWTLESLHHLFLQIWAVLRIC